MTEASTEDVVGSGRLASRADLLRAQREALATLDRSAFLRARSGLLLGALALLGGYGGLSVVLGWNASRDGYHHPDPTAPLAFYYSGQVACWVDILGSAALFAAALRWSLRRRRIAMRDRTDRARALPGPVPAPLATRYDARHEPAPEWTVDLDAESLVIGGPGVPFTLAGVAGLVVGMLTAIAGLVSLWDPVDPDHPALKSGQALGAGLALTCGVVTAVVWCGISVAVSCSAVPRRLAQVEGAVYPLRPGDRVAERATGRLNNRSALTGLGALVLLAAVSMARVARDGLLGVALWGPLAVFTVGIVWLARRNRTLPLLVHDGPGRAPLTCRPGCAVSVSYDGPTLTVTPRRGNRPPLVLTRDQAAGLVNVRPAPPAAPLAVAVTGADDVLVVVSGTDASRAVRDWWGAGA